MMFELTTPFTLDYFTFGQNQDYLDQYIPALSSHEQDILNLIMSDANFINLDFDLIFDTFISMLDQNPDPDPDSDADSESNGISDIDIDFDLNLE